MHLNDLEAFKKVLPSKLFEYGVFDKPVIAGVSGYAAKFVAENLPNHILFSPTNVGEFVDKLRNYTLSFVERSEFRKKFSRKKIMHEMAHDILKFK